MECIVMRSLNLKVKSSAKIRDDQACPVSPTYNFSFEPDVVLCSVSVIPLQHRSSFVCMSFVRLGHHNG